MECNFFVGQKVVCVDEDWNPLIPPHIDRLHTHPKKGCTYTVRDIVACGFGIGIRLQEIINPIVAGYSEEAIFHHTHFRPTTEHRVEELRKLLKNIPVKV